MVRAHAQHVNFFELCYTPPQANGGTQGRKGLPYGSDTLVGIPPRWHDTIWSENDPLLSGSETGSMQRHAGMSAGELEMLTVTLELNILGTVTHTRPSYLIEVEL